MGCTSSVQSCQSAKQIQNAQTCVVSINILLDKIYVLENQTEQIIKIMVMISHCQSLLNFIDFNKIQNSELDEQFYINFKQKIDDLFNYLDKNFSKQTKGGIDEQIEVFFSDIDQKRQILMKSVQADDESKDKFPDFLKTKYQGKPGYEAWKAMFKNKEIKKIGDFIDRYTDYNDQDRNHITIISKKIDRDNNEIIYFEEFMDFINQYIQYYDEKGKRVKNIQQLVQLIDQEMQKKNEISVQEKKISYQDGKFYEGEIVDGKRHGKGKHFLENVYSYEGEFQNDLKHGFGIEIKNNYKYEGQWQNDQKNGKGKITYTDGSFYEGDFKDNMPQGKGIFTSNDGTKYDGTYVMGYMVIGTIYYKNGDRYEGQTKETKLRHGRGKMILAQNKQTIENNFYLNLECINYNYFNTQDKQMFMKMKQEIMSVNIDLADFQNHDPTLLSQINNLKILRINFKNKLQVQENKQLLINFINNLNPQSYLAMSELTIILPGCENVKLKSSDLNDICIVLQKFKNIVYLDLQLPSWGNNNNQIDGSTIQELINTYQSFSQLKSLKLNLFEWGYQNSNIKHDEAIKLIESQNLFKGQLNLFEIDLGRWGCNGFDNFQHLTNSTLQKFAEIIKLQQNLQTFGIDLRSWPYKNQQITDNGFQDLFNGISELKNLKKLNLGLRSVAHDGQIQQPLLENLAQNLKKLTQLEEIVLNLECCDNFNSFEPIKEAFKSLPKLVKHNLISDRLL